MSRLSPRLDVLPAAQQAIWPHLRDVKRLGWVLYGGTAIALRLGHRASIDFDFFNDRPLDRALLTEACPALVRSVVLQDRPDTLTVVTIADGLADAVKLSFFGGLDFGRVGEPAITADGVAYVASLDDLLAHKLKVLLQRVEAKDYLDVAALIGAGVRLDRGLASARALFGPAFQPSEALKALVYFEGGDLHSLPSLVKQSLIGAVRSVDALPHVDLASRALGLQSV